MKENKDTNVGNISAIFKLSQNEINIERIANRRKRIR